MFSKLKHYVNSFSPQKPNDQQTDQLVKSQPVPLPIPLFSSPDALPVPLSSVVFKNEATTPNQITFSLDSIWRPKRSTLPPIQPIVFEEDKDTWKNIQSNTGTFLIKRHEICWKMLHENNIDLGRGAEV